MERQCSSPIQKSYSAAFCVIGQFLRSETWRIGTFLLFLQLATGVLLSLNRSTGQSKASEPTALVQACSAPHDGDAVSKRPSAKGVNEREPFELRHTFAHKHRILGAIFNREGSRILTWDDQNTFHMWDVRHGKLLQTVTHDDTGKFTSDVGLPPRAGGAIFSAKGSRFLTWSGRTWSKDEDVRIDGRYGAVRVWDTARGRLLQNLEHRQWLSRAIFTSNGSKVVTFCEDGAARLWDVSSGTLLREFRHDPDPAALESDVLGGIVYAKVARLLTWSEDGTARLWNVRSGRLLKTFRHPINPGYFFYGAMFRTRTTITYRKLRESTWQDFVVPVSWNLFRRSRTVSIS